MPFLVPDCERNYPFFILNMRLRHTIRTLLARSAFTPRVDFNIILGAYNTLFSTSCYIKAVYFLV